MTVKKLVAGNWKMNGSIEANDALVRAVVAGLGHAAPGGRGRPGPCAHGVQPARRQDRADLVTRKNNPLSHTEP